MYNKKMLFTLHPWLPEAGTEATPGRAGSGKSLYLRTLDIKLRFFLHCQKRSLKGWFIKLGCYFFSSWHCIKHNSICTTGQVLKTNKIYTFVEDGYVDIVRLLEIYINKGYVYCTLYFLTKNKILTVSEILNPDDYTIWRIMDNEEYDERMSMPLWQ
jgi:hypothetical protein